MQGHLGMLLILVLLVFFCLFYCFFSKIRLHHLCTAYAEHGQYERISVDRDKIVQSGNGRVGYGSNAALPTRDTGVIHHNVHKEI